MSAGFSRHLISGLRASVPVPEHGASTNTESKRRLNGSRSSASIATGRTLASPKRLIRRSLCKWRSAATTVADSASILAFPPGAAQTSSTTEPRSALTRAPTRCELRSWNVSSWAASAAREVNRYARGWSVGRALTPSLPSRSMAPLGSSGAGMRKKTAGRPRFAVRSLAQSPRPNADSQRLTSHAGWLRRAAWGSGGEGGSPRRTALTKEAAERLRAVLTSSTDSETAAWSATPPMCRSW